jgi:hypothetical protein
MFTGSGIQSTENTKFPQWDAEMRASAWASKAAVENDGFESLSDNSDPDDVSDAGLDAV